MATPAVNEQLASFQNIWRGGAFEGDPLDPMGRSTYGSLGYMSVLHATYLCCIKPYVTPTSVVLEIGPGRGAWTKTMLAAQEVWCLDALSAEHNHFWEYVGTAPQVRYQQVTDFSCSGLPDDHFTYFFSFGTFCHIPFWGVTEYLRNLFPKLRSGCRGFLMVADYAKYNHAVSDFQPYSAWRVCDLLRPKKPLKAAFWRRAVAYVQKTALEHQANFRLRSPDENDTPRPARWYDAGTDRTCALLSELGYDVIDQDVGVLHRDPVIHFRKP
jgi:phospholipid N-methyltransferase